jgi:hypothetical protein
VGAIFEWYESNQHTSYPFRDRQQEGLHELFVDAAVFHNLYRDKAGDIRINYYRLEPAASVELRFADGTVLAYLTDGAPGVVYQTQVFGAYTLYEWRRSTVDGNGFTDEDVIIRLVVLTARLADLPTEFYPADGTLVASTINPAAKRVRRLFVKRALSGELDLVTHQKVHFEAGNNLEFVLDPGVAGTDVTIRQPSKITVNAAAGLGTGVEYRCSGGDGIKRINQVEPDARGDFKLESSLCSWFERPMKNSRSPIHPNTDVLLDPADAQWPYNAPVAVGPGLIMHQDCKACCSCDDYVNAYRTMLAWWERAQAVALRVQQLQATYNALCTLMNAGQGKIPVGVNGSLFMLARPDFNMAFSFLLYNNSDAALGTTQLVIEVDQPPAVLDYIVRSGYLDFGGSNNFQIDPLIATGGMGTKYTAVVAGLKQGTFARFTMNLRANALLPTRASTVLTGRATATWTGGSVEDLQRMQLTPPTIKG